MNRTQFFTKLEENAPFKVIFLIGKQGRPEHLNKITMLPLYKTPRPITREIQRYDEFTALFLVILTK